MRTYVIVGFLNKHLPDPAAGEVDGQQLLWTFVRLKVSLVPQGPPVQTFHNLSSEDISNLNKRFAQFLREEI